LFDYYELLGKYNLVDNQISSLLLAYDDPSEILPGLITYYEELLEKSDLDLSAGGISRVRVQAQLDAVNNLIANNDLSSN
ncbi:MAG: hypothetical protein IMY85_02085, partial [Chloroflexi bacterium]|nr:hypothetical protein [Chloroflexota bacterium]